MWRRVDDLVVKAMIAAEPTMSEAMRTYVPAAARGEPNRQCFQAFGFDVMLDAEAKPWLLEVRLDPRPLDCLDDHRMPPLMPSLMAPWTIPSVTIRWSLGSAQVNLDPALRTESPLDLKIKSSMLIDLLNVVSIPLPPATPSPTASPALPIAPLLPPVPSLVPPPLGAAMAPGSPMDVQQTATLVAPPLPLPTAAASATPREPGSLPPAPEAADAEQQMLRRVPHLPAQLPPLPNMTGRDVALSAELAADAAFPSAGSTSSSGASSSSSAAAGAAAGSQEAEAAAAAEVLAAAAAALVDAAAALKGESAKLENLTDNEKWALHLVNCEYASTAGPPSTAGRARPSVAQHSCAVARPSASQPTALPPPRLPSADLSVRKPLDGSGCCPRPGRLNTFSSSILPAACISCPSTYEPPHAAARSRARRRVRSVSMRQAHTNTHTHTMAMATARGSLVSGGLAVEAAVVVYSIAAACLYARPLLGRRE